MKCINSYICKYLKLHFYTIPSHTQFFLIKGISNVIVVQLLYLGLIDDAFGLATIMRRLSDYKLYCVWSVIKVKEYNVVYCFVMV